MQTVIRGWSATTVGELDISVQAMVTSRASSPTAQVSVWKILRAAWLVDGCRLQNACRNIVECLYYAVTAVHGHMSIWT